MPFELIIWDCDGCLIDSEVLACMIAAEHITRLGYYLSTGSYISRFAGRGMETALRTIEEETGEPFRARFDPDCYREDTLRIFREQLQAIEGVNDIMPQLTLKQCVASGSPIQQNIFALKTVGLLPYFEDHIFSVHQVERGKPAPDVFLFASQEMGVDPSNCLVIEDSPPGVQAAKEAGMSVWAFMGGRHIAAPWRARVAAENPDLIFDKMLELPSLLRAHNGLC